jgi:hypothetical protein
MRFADTLREPYRKRFVELIKSVYQNISGIVFVNSLNDEEMIIYAMLSRLELNTENKEKIMRCISILISK